MKKIIQISQAAAENGYTLMCLTEDGKVYERITVYNYDKENKTKTTKTYWREVEEEVIIESSTVEEINF